MNVKRESDDGSNTCDRETPLGDDGVCKERRLSLTIEFRNPTQSKSQLQRLFFNYLLDEEIKCKINSK